MPHKRNVYVERDRHGRERLVLTGGRRRSSSGDHSGISSAEMLSAAQERIQELEAQLGHLQTRLSFEQSKEWNTRRENERLTADNYHLRDQLELESQEVRRLDDLLHHEEKRFDKLEEKYRALKRSRSRSRSGSSEYRRAYEEKAQEVELLRARCAERDQIISLDQARRHEKDRALREKNDTITYLKNYLRTHGFRVEG